MAKQHRHVSSWLRPTIGTLALAGVFLISSGQYSYGLPIVGNGKIPEPSTVWGKVYQADYKGTPSSSPPWDDKSEETWFEENNDLSHSYNPNTNTITLGNVADSDLVKRVWIQLTWTNSVFTKFNEQVTRGQPMDPNEWAVAAAPGSAVNPTGAAWKLWGQSGVELWQTWTINPQPGGETIDISNIVAIAGKQPGTIRAETVCTPEPTTALFLAAGLAGLGLVGRRRSRH